MPKVSSVRHGIIYIIGFSFSHSLPFILSVLWQQWIIVDNKWLFYSVVPSCVDGLVTNISIHLCLMFVLDTATVCLWLSSRCTDVRMGNDIVCVCVCAVGTLWWIYCIYFECVNLELDNGINFSSMLPVCFLKMYTISIERCACCCCNCAYRAHSCATKRTKVLFVQLYIWKFQGRQIVGARDDILPKIVDSQFMKIKTCWMGLEHKKKYMTFWWAPTIESYYKMDCNGPSLIPLFYWLSQCFSCYVALETLGGPWQSALGRTCKNSPPSEPIVEMKSTPLAVYWLGKWTDCHPVITSRDVPHAIISGPRRQSHIRKFHRKNHSFFMPRLVPGTTQLRADTNITELFVLFRKKKRKLPWSLY